MKLNELILPNETNIRKILRPIESKFETIQNFLISKGYNEIGMGAFSSVYAKPLSKNIVKISYLSDKPWMNFYQICKEVNSFHLPKMSKMITYKNGSELMFITLIEKLDNLKNNKEVLKMVAASMITNNILPDCWDIYIKKNEIKKYLLKLNQDFPEFEKMILFLKQKKGKSILDLHSKNIMLRHNTPVIIDPFATKL